MTSLLQNDGFIWLIPSISLLSFVLSVLNKNSTSRIYLFNLLAGLTNILLFIAILINYLDVGKTSTQITWAKIGDTTLTIGATVDALSISMIGLVSVVTFLIKLYSLQYMKGDSKFGWYFACISLFSAAMYGVVLSDNLLFLYGSW